MYKCTRCLMTFREDEPGHKSESTVCAELGCGMSFIHCNNGHGTPTRIHATPDRPIPPHVVKVEAA